MQFSVKVTDYQKNLMLNICDIDLLGKNIVEDELNMNISKSYYGEKIIEHEEAKTSAKKCFNNQHGGKKNSFTFTRVRSGF